MHNFTAHHISRWYAHVTTL